MGEEFCLSWLPGPLINSKRFWYLTSQRRHREKNLLSKLIACLFHWFIAWLLGWFFITWIGFVQMTNYLIGDLFCSIWVSSADAPLINRSLGVAKSSCCLLGYEDVPDFFQHLFNLMKQKRATVVCSRQNCVSNWRLRFLSSVLSLIWYAAFAYIVVCMKLLLWPFVRRISVLPAKDFVSLVYLLVVERGCTFGCFVFVNYFSICVAFVSFRCVTLSVSAAERA